MSHNRYGRNGRQYEIKLNYKITAISQYDFYINTKDDGLRDT